MASYFFAGIHIGLGENDRAIEYLEKSFEEHSHWLIYLHIDPSMDGLRDNPRFQTCCRVSAFRTDDRGFHLRTSGSNVQQRLKTLLVGLAFGTALTLASVRLIQSFLYGVTARDGRTLACAATPLSASGLSEAWLPARAAASVDPMKALRTE